MKITIEVEGDTVNIETEGPFTTSTVTQTLRAIADQIDNWVEETQSQPAVPFTIQSVPGIGFNIQSQQGASG